MLVRGDRFRHPMGILVGEGWWAPATRRKRGLQNATRARQEGRGALDQEPYCRSLDLSPHPDERAPEPPKAVSRTTRSSRWALAEVRGGRVNIAHRGYEPVVA